jgi:hypothetical protein
MLLDDDEDEVYIEVLVEVPEQTQSVSVTEKPEKKHRDKTSKKDSPSTTERTKSSVCYLKSFLMRCRDSFCSRSD